MKYLKNSNKKFRHIIATPFILSLIIPLIIADIWVELYHRVSFPLYGIKIITRSNYIKIDRHKLKYLNLRQKMYCVYCGYANGVVQYWAKIAGETEAYWCGIQHKKDPNFIAPKHHKKFAKYGDNKDFKDKYLN